MRRGFLPCPVLWGWGLGHHKKQLCLKRSCCKMGSWPREGWWLQAPGSHHLPPRYCRLGSARLSAPLVSPCLSGDRDSR